MSFRNFRAAVIETLREHCAENGLTPYIWVKVDDNCQVPLEYVQDGVIVLDIEDEAIRGFGLTDEALFFDARFDEDVMHVVVPLPNIVHAAPGEAPALGASFMLGQAAAPGATSEDDAPENRPRRSRPGRSLPSPAAVPCGSSEKPDRSGASAIIDRFTPL